MQHARFYFVLLCLTAVASISFAQTKAKALGPDEIVAKLYKDQKAETGPFNQTKSRALVDRFFMEDLADMIWKDAVAAKGEIGAIDFDPLFGSQDPQVTDFKINKSGWASDAKFTADKAVVEVTFKEGGRKKSVRFAFRQDKAGVWKIDNIGYPDKSSLREIFGALAPAKS